MLIIFATAYFCGACRNSPISNASTDTQDRPLQASSNVEIAPKPSGNNFRPHTVSGGLLNSKAINLPQPKYPTSARLTNVVGKVSVQVMVDETGSVVAATAFQGPPKLRRAAEDAARKAQFDPLVISGQNIKFAGVLTYQFPPDQQ